MSDTPPTTIPSPNDLKRGHRSITLRLAANEYTCLCALAEQAGVTPARLAETWIYLQMVDSVEVEQ